MSQPLVSIALASYNGAKYITQQIESIRRQTYKNIEIIVSDDMSTDGTLDILDHLHRQGIIKEVGNRQKLGVIKNFENALRYCTGSYVAFADQDDVWLPDKIEKSLSLLVQLEQEHGKNTPALVYTDATVVDDQLNVISTSYLGTKKLNPSQVKLRHLIVENVPTGCTMLMNRALANKISEIPSKVTMHDVFTALTASCFGKMAYLDEPTLLYRQHAQNVYGLAKKSLWASLLTTVHVLFDHTAKSQFLAKEMAQAEAFYTHFQHALSSEERELLLGFTHLTDKGKIGRMYFLLKHKIVKGYWPRTLNLLLKV